MKFLCEQCKAKYQIADEKAAGRTIRMKCRKCGHLIEVRAVITETGLAPESIDGQRSSAPPNGPPKPAGAEIGVDAGHARPAGSSANKGMAQAQPAATTSTPAAARLASGHGGQSKVAGGGALEGAFVSAVQSGGVSGALPRRAPRPGGDEAPASSDSSDPSHGDEWYVGINGVPVGPIRVSEVRRKAVLGAITEDSLVWQEGLDEWRPLRSFPELAASVREAILRASRPPSSETRSSHPPPPPSRTGRPMVSLGAGGRVLPPRSPPSAAPRSNVVPFVSRLATAERLDEALLKTADPLLAQPEPQPVAASAIADPFAAAMPTTAAAPSLAEAPALLTGAPSAVKGAPPWMALAMIAAAVAFGVTAAVALFVRPPAPTAPAAQVGSPASPTPRPSAAPVPATPVATETAEPTLNQPATTIKGSPGGTSPKVAAAAPQTPGRALDLHALTQNAPNIAPIDEPGGGDAPKAAGQCFSEGQVQQVIGLHQTGIRRACWERNPTSKPTVNVGISMTIGPDGSAQGVVASGDEPSVSKCIENDVRGWRFPAMGCAQKTSFSLKFVRQ